jgi:hypothetical protein
MSLILYFKKINPRSDADPAGAFCYNPDFPQTVYTCEGFGVTSQAEYLAGVSIHSDVRLPKS